MLRHVSDSLVRGAEVWEEIDKGWVKQEAGVTWCTQQTAMKMELEGQEKLEEKAE